MLSEDDIWRARVKSAVVAARWNIPARALRWFASRRYRIAQARVGFHAPASVRFAGRPVLPHGWSGIFIARSARLGRDCVIFHQVTIGANQLADSRGLGSPTIGDRCYIGAGAKIIGGIVIGDDVRIGANATVTRDVPANATVVGFNQVLLSPTPKDNRFFFIHDGRWSYLREDTIHAADDTTARILRDGFRRE